MSSVVIAGDTSGAITLAAPAVAGSTTLTLPATTGTVALDVSSGSATTFLTSNVTLNNTGAFFSVVNTGSIGANGQKWLISGNAVVKDTAGAANMALQVTDLSANVYVSGAVGTISAGFEVNWQFSFVVTLTGATTFVLGARDTTSTNGVAIASSVVTGVTANKISYINAVRLS